jgi:hypothetical protein
VASDETGESNAPDPATGSEGFELSEASVRELLIQAHQTHRTYIDLRFKHFTDYMVTVGILGAAAFKVGALSSVRPYTCIFGAVVSVLYWRIDARTNAYIQDAAARAAQYARALGASRWPERPPTSFGSSSATNVLFALFIIAWLVTAGLAFSR